MPSYDVKGTFEVTPHNDGDGCATGITAIIGLIVISLVLAVIIFLCNLPLELINSIFNTEYCFVRDLTPQTKSPCLLGEGQNKNPSRVNTPGSSASQSSNTSEDQNYSVYNNGQILVVYTDKNQPARIRSGPTISSVLLGKVAPGTELVGVQTVSGDEVTRGNSIWWEINYDGRRGYIYSQLVQLK